MGAKASTRHRWVNDVTNTELSWLSPVGHPKSQLHCGNWLVSEGLAEWQFSLGWGLGKSHLCRM